MKVSIQNIDQLIDFIEFNQVATIKQKVIMIEKCLNVIVTNDNPDESQLIETLLHWKANILKPGFEKPIFFDLKIDTE
jgi:hypothetical protein